MLLCPKCNAELPADARFCNKCGFNQTNARLAAAQAQAQQHKKPENSASPISSEASAGPIHVALTPNAIKGIPPSPFSQASTKAQEDAPGQKTVVPLTQVPEQIKELKEPEEKEN